MMKRAFFFDGKSTGCTFYRVRQPCQSLADNSKKYDVALSSNLSIDEQSVCLDSADVILTQHHSEKFLEYVVKEKRNRLIVFDCDDNLFSVPPICPSYEKYGLREVTFTLPNGQEIGVKDGQGGFSIAENKHRLDVFAETIKQAGIVTTTNNVLSGVFKRLNRNTMVIRNTLNLDVWKPLNIVKDGTVRIGYQGGFGHYQDLLLVVESLKEIMAKHPNVVMVFMGERYDGPMNELPKDRVEFHPWIDVMAYPWKFKTLNLDIGIAPLENSLFNNCKSEIKWEEYSALGIPCVASNVVPYSLAIRHGHTGFLASNPAEWTEYLSRLITDADCRRYVGGEAMSYVKEHYDCNKNFVEYEDAFRGTGFITRLSRIAGGR